jgi:hypothetical protein
MKWLNWIFSMVPVIANGFDDIRERVEAQTQQATAHTQKLQVCVRHFYGLYG